MVISHLSGRAAWMLLDGAPSWRQGRWPQPVIEAQDLSEQRTKGDPGRGGMRLKFLACPMPLAQLNTKKQNEF